MEEIAAENPFLTLFWPLNGDSLDLRTSQASCRFFLRERPNRVLLVEWFQFPKQFLLRYLTSIQKPLASPLNFFKQRHSCRNFLWLVWRAFRISATRDCCFLQYLDYMVTRLTSFKLLLLLKIKTFSQFSNLFESIFDIN